MNDTDVLDSLILAHSDFTKAEREELLYYINKYYPSENYTNTYSFPFISIVVSTVVILATLLVLDIGILNTQNIIINWIIRYAVLTAAVVVVLIIHKRSETFT